MRNKLTKIVLAASIALALAFTFSCHDGGSDETGTSSSGGTDNSSPSGGSSSSVDVFAVDTSGTFLDSRDGQAYKWVKIGTQIWMAKNLNYDVPGNDTDVCYNNEPANCTKYGKLYDWATVMVLSESCNSNPCASQVRVEHQGICPSDWHIPSGAEWTALINFVGANAGTKLKAKSGWDSYNGTDDYGFAALPGGGYYRGSFGYVGRHGDWWSSSENNNDGAYYRTMSYNNEEVYLNDDKSYMLSVRCVKNGEDTPSSSSHLGSSSSSERSNIFYDTPVTYQGEIYPTVVIGSQIWMAKNLNYDVPGNDTDVCYNNEPANCTIYGRLYDWVTAKSVCPSASGWRLPSNADWAKLMTAVGNSATGTKLKATSRWNPYSGVPSGTDTYGFSALPGGYYSGYFDGVGINGSWWSSSEHDSDRANGRSMTYDYEYVNYTSLDKNYLFSVRCVKDY